jgi:hypothetical protein
VVKVPFWGMPIDMQLKVRENRSRRMAKRRRLLLEKSRTRDPWGWDYGRYWLHRQRGSGQWAGWELVTPQDGVTLDDVEAFLVAYRPPALDDGHAETVVTVHS